MRKVLLKAACLGACALLASNLSFGQNAAGQVGSKTITTAVPFLLVTPDSRSGAMGETGVAITDDANAMHWNASALAFAEKRMGFAMSYSPWLRALGIPDINLMYLSGYYNIGEKGGVIGSSLRYFSLGEIQYTDILGEAIGQDKPSEFALDVGYARKVTESLSAAVSLRYFNSRLSSNGGLTPDARPVNSVAGDLSFFYTSDFKIKSAGKDLPVDFSAGMNLSNLGPKVSYTASTADRDFIPINLRLGYAFKFHVDEYNSVTFTNDFNKLLVPSEGGRSNQALMEGIFGSFGDAEGGFREEISEINVAVGFEYWYRELFAARIGYFYEPPEKGNRQFITLGAGLKYNVFGLHFAYLTPLEQNHPLQNTLRFTLTYDFQSAGNE